MSKTFVIYCLSTERSVVWCQKKRDGNNAGIAILNRAAPKLAGYQQRLFVGAIVTFIHTGVRHVSNIELQ